MAKWSMLELHGKSKLQGLYWSSSYFSWKNYELIENFEYLKKLKANND